MSAEEEYKAALLQNQVAEIASSKLGLYARETSTGPYFLVQDKAALLSAVQSEADAAEQQLKQQQQQQKKTKKQSPRR